MKIIFIDWNSFCNQDVVEALEELGHSVKKIPAEKKDLFDSMTQIEKLFHTCKDSRQYEAVFSMSYFPQISNYCKDKGLKYISWVYDNPYVHIYSYTIVNPCNYVFLFDYQMYEELNLAGIKTVYYMPMAANTRRLNRLFHRTKNHDRYKADISFVGSLYSEGKNNLYEKIGELDEFTRGYVEAIVNIQLKLYGVNIIKEALTKEILSSMEKVFPMDPNPTTVMSQEAIYADYIIGRKVTALERKQVLEMLNKEYNIKLYTNERKVDIPGITNQGYVEYYEEMPLVFHNSKINLNITLKSIKEGIPLRVWDILGAGGFLITNYQSELMEYFTPEEDLVIYNDLGDLKEKTEFYLKNDDIRRKIAANGLEKVRSDHNYINRLTMMMEIVEK